MSARVQRWCAWCGPGFIALWLVGFWALAGFLPPPEPKDSADEILQMFRDDTDRIRLGLILAMFGSVLLIPWAAVFTVQLKRIEGRSAPLAYSQLAAGAAGSVFFVFPVMYLQIASFRLDRSPDLVQLMNDMFWLPFVGVPAYLMVQTLTIGFAILQDRREDPVFPRWSGYFNLWVTLIIVPAAVVVFFNDGPFAWNGVLAWWIPLTIFVVWFVVMFRVLLDVIRRQERVAEPSDAVSRAEHEALAAEVEALRRDLPGHPGP